MTRGKRMLVLVAVTLTACLGVCTTAQAGGVVGVPVIIDSFGNPNLAAGPFTRSVIPLPAAATFNVGSPGSFTINTGHDFPTAVLSIPAGSLPSGVSFVDNGDGTASISGTPAAGDGGVYTFDVTASNGTTPNAVTPFALTIDEPPSITSPAAATFKVASPGSFTIKTGHDFPSAALSIPAGSLPSGVSFKDSGDGTASISGTPAAGDGGVYTFDVMASNGTTPNAVVPFTLTIDKPPAVAIAAAPSVQITSPTGGASYQRGQLVTAGYRCEDGANSPGLASCAGTVAAGKPIDTSTLGQHTFTVTATSKDGQRAETAVTYTVALSNNEFTITRVRTKRNGTVGFTLTLPGAGTADVLETAWLDNFASAATLLQPAPRRFVFVRAHLDMSTAGTIAVMLTPNRRGKRLVARHRYQIVIRLWVSYTPADGAQRNIGLDGLHINHVGRKRSRHAK
jgi:large repetitive protein